MYALLDTDKEALYVGKSTGSNERLGRRLSRHVPNGRSDAANKVFPPYEVRYVRVWPVVKSAAGRALTVTQKTQVARVEQFLMWTLLTPPFPPFPPLNENIPRVAPPAARLPVPVDIDYWPASVVTQLADRDARVARWAISVSRLAERVKHGNADPALRDVQKRQIERLASLV